MQRTLLFWVVVAFIPRAAAAQGEPVGPEFRVNTYTTGDQGFAAVSADASGNFVVVWQSAYQDGSDNGIFGQRYASTGEPVGPEFRVNTYTTNRQYSPAVASDASGNFVVVWTSYTQDGSSDGIFGQRYDSTGEPLGPEFRVNTYTTSDQDLGAVSSDASGNFVVVWRSSDQEDGSSGIFGQRYASTGEPLGPEVRVNSYTTDSPYAPAVSSDTSGNFVVVWRSSDQPGDGFGVFGQRFASTGEALGPEFRVNTYPTYQDIPFPAAVDSDAAGNFVVVWADKTRPYDGRQNVFGQAFASSGAPLGREFRINTYRYPWSSFLPTVASVSSGSFIVVWQSVLQDGSSTGIFGRRCCSSTGVLGPEFRVNTYTTNTQFIPAVASDSSGNFVVIWNGEGQNDVSGVFGQRYKEIAPGPSWKRPTVPVDP